MHKAAATMIGLVGVAAIIAPNAIFLWAHQSYTTGISGMGEAVLLFSTLAGIGCVFAGYRLSNRQKSN